MTEPRNVPHTESQSELPQGQLSQGLRSSNSGVLRRSLTLRGRLITITVAILTVIGLCVGAAAVAAVRSSLIDDLDAQLRTMTQQARNAPQPPGGSRGPGAGQNDPLRFLALPGQGDGTIAAVTDGSAARGQIARAGQGAPMPLEDSALRGLIGISPDQRPQTVRVDGLGSYRVVAVAAGGTRVVYGLPQTGVDSAVAQTMWKTALVVVIGVATSGMLAGWMISRSLRPLREVAHTAAEVSQLDLGRGEPAPLARVPERLAVRGSEVGDVGWAMNHMLDHVDSALQARYDSEQQVRRFVADASHELRTPLATIRGYADLTKPLRNQSPEQVGRALERIDAGALRMSGLVDDLLLLARLDAGREPMVTEPVDLSALLLEAVDDAHAVSPEHRFVIDLPDQPVIGMAMPAQAMQVFTNVIANARTHTPVGTTVTVQAEARDYWAEVRISDDGAGIDPEIADRVFDRFVRSGAERSRSAGAQTSGGSSGLGLPIGLALMTAMGGDISMQTDDSGTTFTLRFTAAA